MNDINPQTPITPNTTSLPVVPPTESKFQKIWIQIKPILEQLFNKIYSNKLIFWSMSILFGIIFLIIILGLLFGKKTQKVFIPTPSPVPFILRTPTVTSNSDILSVSKEKLNKIKNETNNVDVRQRRLLPPNINFDIKF